MARPSEKLWKPIPVAIDMPRPSAVRCRTASFCSATAMAPGPISLAARRDRWYFPRYRSDSRPAASPPAYTTAIRANDPHTAPWTGAVARRTSSSSGPVAFSRMSNNRKSRMPAEAAFRNAFRRG